MKTYSALFAGGDLAGKGLESAGLRPINLFELCPRISEVGQANSTGKYVVGDICDVDFRRYEKPDVFWASPVCKNASQAKSGGEESTVDIDTAKATCRAIETWLPEVVFIENVWGYRRFAAYEMLINHLTQSGYWFQVHHLNSADFSVPQTRKRLIIRATRNGWLPPLPNKTAWRGWHEAIEDLIPKLPESAFAEWQLARLPEHFSDSFLQMTGNTQLANPTGTGMCLLHEPCNTVVASSHALRSRAFILSTGQNKNGESVTIREADEPLFTITSSEYARPTRAWLSQGRVVKMTPRALGRFQSLPDSYELSGNAALDCTIIGNGVPCLLAQKLAEPFIN